MKKIIPILTILGAFIDTIFDLHLLESIGITGVYADYVKLGGLLISTILAYYETPPKNDKK